MASKGKGGRSHNKPSGDAGSTNSEYNWNTLKPMPTKRVFATAVGVEGQLHVLGGCDAKGVPVDNLESYNAKKNQWNRLRNMPTPRAGVSAVSIGKKLLTFGGVNVKQEPTDCLEIYDVTAKDWQGADQKIDTMTERLLGLSSVVRGDRAIVVGGMGFDTNPKDYIMSYDIETNRWQSLQPMPTPRYATFSFILDDRLYVLGGRQGKLPVASFECLDFKEGKWKKLPDVPSKRVFALYAHSDYQLFSVGGLHPDPKDGFSDAMEIFDIRNEEWMLGKPVPTKRGDFAVGFQGGKVIAAGGLGNTGKPLTEVEAYDQSTDSWSKQPDMPNAHCSCAFTMFQDKLHVAGGLTIGGPSASVEVLSYNK